MRPADPAAQEDAGIFRPFEFQLQAGLENLEEQGIIRPDFERIGPADASVWADGVAEKFSISLANIWIRCPKICLQESATITTLG